MTPEEKLAQIRHIHSWEIFNGQALDERKLEEKAQGMSWGSLRGFPDGRKLCKEYASHPTLHGRENSFRHSYLYRSGIVTRVVHEGATVFPQNIALGSTFDTDLAYRKTSMIADELHAVGMRQVLSPALM
ncbi:hypothetical protein BFINE_18780 [Bacteroides finegoldii DSM 17565]|nr:hypothetical protein BFINE_18780 [Bacteroides finegoldii DSM 17565]